MAASTGDAPAAMASVNDANDAVVRIRDVTKKADEAAKAKPELASDVAGMKSKLQPLELWCKCM